MPTPPLTRFLLGTQGREGCYPQRCGSRCNVKITTRELFTYYRLDGPWQRARLSPFQPLERALVTIPLPVAGNIEGRSRISQSGSTAHRREHRRRVQSILGLSGTLGSVMSVGQRGV